MSKLHLINEITTAIKMASEDEVKLAHYLDDLLSNYKVEEIEEEDVRDNNDDYIHMYISSRRVENYSENTLSGYQYELRRFTAFIEKSLIKVKTNDIRQYLAAHAHLKQSTIVKKLNTISAFYAWLVKEEAILKNPRDKINTPRLPQKMREGLTMIELEQVRNACKDARQRALIELFYSTGCRLDEIRKIDIADIDWASESIIVNGKGDKDRRVFLSEKAAWYLKLYLDTRDDDCPALIASERKPIHRLSRTGIYSQVRKIQKQSDLDKELYPHKLRHTFAQLNLNNGMKLSDLQALMGHNSPATTLIYAQTSDERKHRAFKQHHQQ